MSKPLKKFSTQADPELLKLVKDIAQEEGKQFQALIEEALRDLIDKKKTLKPRKHIMNYFADSLKEYDSLYKELAK